MISKSNQFLLNRMNSVARKTDLGDLLRHRYGVRKGIYDFSVNGGAIGTIKLLDADSNPVVLPSGALITRAYLDVVTTLLSAGSATVTLGLEAAGDVFASNPFSDVAAGRMDGAQDGAAANMVLLTADRTLSFAIATAALTAGKFNCFVEYVLSRD